MLSDGDVLVFNTQTKNGKQTVKTCDRTHKIPRIAYGQVQLAVYRHQALILAADRTMGAARLVSVDASPDAAVCTPEPSEAVHAVFPMEPGSVMRVPKRLYHSMASRGSWAMLLAISTDSTIELIIPKIAFRAKAALRPEEEPRTWGAMLADASPRSPELLLICARELSLREAHFSFFL